MVLKKIMRQTILSRSLQRRMACLLMLANIVSFTFIGLLSYRLYSIQVEQMDSIFIAQTDAEKNKIEDLYSEMNNISQMLDVDNGLGRDVLDFYEIDDIFERSTMFKEINKAISNSYLSNPDIGAVFYYFPGKEQKVQFSNFNVRIEFDPESLPVLYKANRLTYHGPHSSVNPQIHEMVCSVLRDMKDDHGDTLSVYIETKLGPNAETVFPKQILGLKVNHILYNQEGKRLFETGEIKNAGRSLIEIQKEPYCFMASKSAGWHLLLQADAKAYQKEIQKWRIQFLSMAFGSLCMSLLIAFFLWVMIKKPIDKMSKVISTVGEDVSSIPHENFDLDEFQEMFNTYEKSQRRIMDLISDVKEREQREKHLEVEKLLAQINPHFIHNTLNTIQWLARMNGQNEIVRLISLFSRVLYYNMGKKDIVVTVDEELAAVQDYLELQSIRYDNSFKYYFSADEYVGSRKLPRFVLQPLVENALFHGIENGNGNIEIEARADENGVIILTVSDTGKGMPEELIEQINNGKNINKEFGMGIGLQYVRRTIDAYYDGAGNVDINSIVGKGTTIVLKLPEKAFLAHLEK